MKSRVWIILVLLVVPLSLAPLISLASASAGLMVTRELETEAGAPSIVSYQGMVSVDGLPFSGNGSFKFAIILDLGIDCTSYWSNDGTSDQCSEPNDSVPVLVNNGLFTVLLGKDMKPLTADTFLGANRSLRVWFSTTGDRFDPLSPDRQISAVPYALQATNADELDGQHGSAYQLIVNEACDVGSTIRTINSDGTVECDAHDAYPIFSRTVVSTGDSSDHEMTIGADGLPIISIYDAVDDDLKVLHCGDLACTSSANIITTVDSTDEVGQHPSIAIGADGLPVISYVDITNSQLKVLHCGNASCSAGNNATAVNSGAGPILDTSIAIGGYDGLPVISFSGANSLKVLHCGDEACINNNMLTTVDDTPGSGRYNSIAIGLLDGKPVISYAGGAGELKVLHCGNYYCDYLNNDWVVDAAVDIHNDTSITIGADNLPVMSYADWSTEILKVAHCGDVDCTSGNTVTPVETEFSTYGHSITIGTDGLPVIDYISYIGGMVQHCGNAACNAGNTRVLVGEGSTISSITIGTDGLPLFSTYSIAPQELKVVHCGNIYCMPYWRRR